MAIACCIVAFLNVDFNENFDGQHLNAGNIYRGQFWNEYEGKRNLYAVAPTPLGNIIKQNFDDVIEVPLDCGIGDCGNKGIPNDFNQSR